MARLFPRSAARAAATATALGLLWVLAPAAAQKPEKKPPEKKSPIKDIMVRSHTKDGPLNKLGQALKGKRWEEATAMSGELVKGGEDLVKAAAPAKGTAESWKKLTKQYLADTKAIADAVGKKDGSEAKDGLDVLNNSCRTCHSVHK